MNYAAQTAARAAFAERVDQQEAGPVKLLTLPTPTRDVVSWRGSFLTCPDFAAGEEVLQEVVVSLLDKGTEARDRFALARVLEDRGARLQIENDGLRVHVSGQALREDLPAVMEVLAEMLRTPRFTEAEFEKARAQEAAALRRQMESTTAQAVGALTRALYAPAHPNFNAPPKRDLERLEAMTLDEVRRFHTGHFGPHGFLLALAGDVDPGAAALVEEAFGGWPDAGAEARFEANAQPAEAGHSAVEMPDKMNVDVRLGHALGVRRGHDDYLPLYLGTYVLGGNFSARLMTVVRDEMGLTYGINAYLAGMAVEHDGHWQVGVTLSQENLAEGLAATRAEVERFVEGGITAEELAEKKTTLTGSFKVGLATTGRLAQALLSNAERGFPVRYLDDFPGKIEALTLGQVNAAIQQHLHPGRMHAALAGTLPEKAAA